MDTSLAAIGFAIQADGSTPATEPEFQHPVEPGSKLVDFPIEQKEDEMTRSEVSSTSGEYRESVGAVADYTTRAWPQSIGAYLYAIMGGLDASGSLPTTHTITPDALTPFATLFDRLDDEYRVSAHHRLDQLKIEGEGGKPIKVTPSWMGRTVGFKSSLTPVVDEEFLPYFLGVNATPVVGLDAGGTTHDAEVLKWVITMKRNNVADVYSGSLTAGAVHNAGFVADVEATVRVPDMGIVRRLLTGAVDGSNATATVLEGLFGLTLTSGTGSVTISAPRIPWQTERQETGKDGEPGELTLKGKCYAGSGVPAVTAVVVTDYADYQP